MNKLLDNTRIILASKSPRRSFLLKQAGLNFAAVDSALDENTVPFADSPSQYVKTLAEAKAKKVSVNYPDNWVIGADTIVLIDEIILKKPGTREKAFDMLQRLSGRTHQVLTGFCICCETKEKSFSDTVITDVEFKKLNKNEIDRYVNTDEPLDKAGAYAIQGKSAFFVKSINGSYTNVVGLPVCEVVEYLVKEGTINFSS